MRGRKRRRANLEEEAQWKQQNDIGDCSDGIKNSMMLMT